jgi:hypothetical protein
MKALICILACLFAIGCTQVKEEAKSFLEINSESFKDPVLVATNTLKGNLWTVRIEKAHTYHYVYWFDNSTNTVTINFHAHKSNQTIVIDGQTYQLTPIK